MFRKGVRQYIYFCLVNASTGAAMTGATVAGHLSADGGSQTSVTGIIVEDGLGQYHLFASIGDMSWNNIGFLFTATGAIPVHICIATTAADPSDAVRFGLTALPAVASGSAGAIPTTGTGANQISVASGKVAAVTCDTLTTYTGNTPQTGDAFARVGAAGAGLTALGDARIANLDVAVSTRTKPADTQAAVTLVATTTNLTNAPGAGDFTAAMKSSLNAATPASVVGAVGSVTNTGAIADKVLGRSLATGADGGHTVQDALRALRNKIDLVSVPGFALVYQENGTTEAWRAALVTNAGALPITEVSPT